MQVNLFISCRKLPDMDAFSKSDPQCIVYERHHGRWTKVGKTEKISNNLNPDFRTSFTLAYYFEKKQDLKFKIIDDDGDGDADYLGEAEATLGQIMGAKSQIFTTSLTGNRSGKATVTVRSESVSQSNEAAKMAFRIRGLKPMAGGCLGMCNERTGYRLEILKNVKGTDTFTTCWTHHQRLRENDVAIAQFYLPVSLICNAEFDAKIRFALAFETDHRVFNYFETSINKILNGQMTLSGKGSA